MHFTYEEWYVLMICSYDMFLYFTDLCETTSLKNCLDCTGQICTECEDGYGLVETDECKSKLIIYY